MSLNLRAITLATAAVCLLLATAPVAYGNHREATYCSETGDLCQSVGMVDGVRRLQIRTFEGYFGHYRLCVTGPDHRTTCKLFRMRERGQDAWGSSVRWSKHFPNGGRGDYTVKWRIDGERLGVVLGFHI